MNIRNWYSTLFVAGLVDLLRWWAVPGKLKQNSPHAFFDIIDVDVTQQIDPRDKFEESSVGNKIPSSAPPSEPATSSRNYYTKNEDAPARLNLIQGLLIIVLVAQIGVPFTLVNIVDGKILYEAQLVRQFESDMSAKIAKLS